MSCSSESQSESETDLNYPPDSTRFLKFLTLIIRSSIEFLAKYLEIRQADVQVKIDKEIGMDGILKLGIEAGKTEFSFIKK
jgi:hypothetical protein